MQPAEWHLLSDDAQLSMAQQALRHAAGLVARRAEWLAAEMEAGTLADRGGPDALRLLAALLQGDDPDRHGGPIGHA
ncbi:hypothetical protein [Roseomonas sp. BN140053]|uniref:hypothetical protein n=1 Tax=Roseomonas sp. BN140053 TaxID=3391898 RepID=UPI0039EB5137